MQKLTIRDMRSVLGHLDTLLDASGELIITRHGEAIARVLPIHGKRVRSDHKELQALTKKLTSPSEKILRDMRDE